ncbi:MAG: nucleotide exchange factor GrpE, partial [Actinomycetota bacterium]
PPPPPPPPPPPDRPAAEAGATDEGALARAGGEEYLYHLRRLQAEFDNFRKRSLKEQTRSVELAARPVMERLLEVLDDFEMALSASESDRPPTDGFRRGVELVYAKFVDALRSEGLERIEAEGVAFDPNEHEALMQTGDGAGDPVVAEVFRQGYRFRGTVIRPASVRVERP